ncbi:MAG: hypothetical protein Wins2KO_15270 [Winogradskyella sp.]
MEESLNFYNEFDEKLIKDYIFGNKRLENAIINLKTFIPQKAKSILDIGCGIGWSSYEFSLEFDKAKVEGIDLSPVLIDKASKIFTNSNLEFKVFDVTTQIPEKKYDAVVMIDVYEHIPKEKRITFHKALKNILNTSSRLILACPSKYHQDWLRQNDPNGLQPVDEDVDYADISKLATEIGGEVVFFEYQNIWRSLDYFYSVIEISPKYNSGNQLRSKLTKLSESSIKRKQRVETKLGLKLNYEVSKPKSNVKKRLVKGLKKVIRKVL